MKTKPLTFAGRLLLLAGLAGPVAAQAQQSQPGPYSGGDVGGALTDDTRLKAYPGGGGGDVEFDPGIRLSLNGGWRFTEWFRAGGEFGVISQGIRGVDASYAQFPLMADVEFRLPNRTPLTPFIGGGPGFAVTSIAFDDDNLNGGDYIDGTASDMVFMWQVYAGLRYKLNETMSLGLIYKYSEANASSWDVEDTSTDIEFGRTRTQAISVSFSMDF